jgi:hypothetical protein
VSFAARQHGDIYRRLTLSDKPEYQEYRRIELSEVPPLSDAAVLTNVTPYSIRYDDGLHTWYVARSDKTIIRGYRLRRSDADVEDGAFPIVAFFNDEKGLL